MRWLKNFLLMLPFVSGCASVLPTPAPTPVRERQITHKEFRLAAFDFGTLYGEKTDLAKAIPAILLTELHETGRFSLYEGGSIRISIQANGATKNGPKEEGNTSERSSQPKGGLKNVPIDEGNASEHVDGYLSGTITKAAGDQVCFDLRLANAVSHEVLYARAVCVGNGPNSWPRDAFKRLASEIARAVKQVGYGNVTGVDGKLVFCNKGSEAGVKRGMVAFLVGAGDTVRPESVHKVVQEYTGTSPRPTSSSPIVIGEMYIVSVEESHSVGLLYRGDYALPGDIAFFK